MTLDIHADEWTMLSRMNLRLAATSVVAAGVLVGCGSDADPQAGEGATSSPTATTQTSAAGGDTACLLGRWHLDTDDYASQALAYVTGLGVPMESLVISGDQILDFNESPFMNIATDLQLDAVVHGQPLSVSSQSAGGGEWGWNADSTSDIGVDGWEWTAAPTAGPEGAPPLLDPSQGINVNCKSDRLTVRGPGAPLAGVFVRR